MGENIKEVFRVDMQEIEVLDERAVKFSLDFEKLEDTVRVYDRFLYIFV